MPRILIVEDSPTMRTLLSSALEELEGSVKIVEAESGFEALRMLPRERWDLIVTDVNMPDINGLELVSFIRHRTGGEATPILIISTEAAERDRSRALSPGATAYLVKPFEADALVASVRELLPERPSEGP